MLRANDRDPSKVESVTEGEKTGPTRLKPTMNAKEPLRMEALTGDKKPRLRRSEANVSKASCVSARGDGGGPRQCPSEVKAVGPEHAKPATGRAGPSQAGDLSDAKESRWLRSATNSKGSG